MHVVCLHVYIDGWMDGWMDVHMWFVCTRECVNLFSTLYCSKSEGAFQNLVNFVLHLIEEVRVFTSIVLFPQQTQK